MGALAEAGAGRFAPYLRESADGTRRIELAVENIRCAGCMRKIERLREWLHSELDAERGDLPPDAWKELE